MKAQEAAQTIKYDVPLYKQGHLSLCWAFCQVMIESYRNGKTLTQRQARNNAIDIAKKTHGSDKKSVWNNGGWPENIGDRVEVSSINQLYDILVENGPVYAYYSGKKGAHLVVVTGVNLYKGVVYTNNPWRKKGEQSFDSFTKGVAKRWWQSGLGMTFKAIYLIN